MVSHAYQLSLLQQTPLETVACYDVMTDPQADSDLERFTVHLNSIL